MATIEIAGQPLRINNIFCIGRNYAEHAREMGSEVPAEPMVFIKPNSAVLQEGGLLQLPAWSNEVHHELEMVVAIGRGGRNITREAALQHVAGYALGLDLTARDVQGAAKKAGAPWTLAKGFDGAAVLTRFVAAEGIDPAQQHFTLHVNGQLRQSADTSLMMYDLPTLISYLSSRFTLQSGDLIYTGTPQGVGPLHGGDRLELRWPGVLEAGFSVAG